MAVITLRVESTTLREAHLAWNIPRLPEIIVSSMLYSSLNAVCNSMRARSCDGSFLTLS